jgi:hypothetical protein
LAKGGYNQRAAIMRKQKRNAFSTLYPLPSLQRILTYCVIPFNPFIKALTLTGAGATIFMKLTRGNHESDGCAID